MFLEISKLVELTYLCFTQLKIFLAELLSLVELVVFQGFINFLKEVPEAGIWPSH